MMNYIQNAANEQLRSFLCTKQIMGNGQGKGRLTIKQATGFRRRPETIIIEAIDQAAKHEKALKPSDGKKQKRGRRRGPRTLVL